jgi:uncharacterized OsmC-like protein
MNPVTTNQVNGLNMDQAHETVEALQNDPSLGKFVFRARNQWKDGALNEASINGFFGTHEEHDRGAGFVIPMDEPPLLLGEDRGANPVEVVLAALSGCMTTTMALHGAAEGVTIEAMDSELEGHLDVNGFLGLDPEVRRGYQGIQVKFRVKSDASEEQIQELLSRSPVFDILANPTPIDVVVGKM